MSTIQFNSTVPAIRILEHEHHYLTQLMNQWHAIVRQLQTGRYSSAEQARLEFSRLRSLVEAFVPPFINHSKKEEQFFFPMLGQYIGYEQGPIMPIEEEHGEVLSYLNHFLKHAEGEHSLQEMIDMTRDVGEAFEILMIHFVKEESVLFPMTAQLMSKRDQERLFEQLHSLIDE